MRWMPWLACLALSAGCDGDTEDVTGVGSVGARRLSRVEYDSTVSALLLEESHGGLARLPEDVSDPFDNDFVTQQPSAVLVEAAESLAAEASERLLADPPRRDLVVGCVPTSAADAACLRAFIVHFGRLALRRPLTDDEVTRFLSVQDYAVEGGDFYLAVDMVVRALLQHPEFLYRVETGTPATGRPGLYRLDDWQVATRLAYFVWGAGPDDALLDRAADGKLSTPAQVKEAAEAMLADPRARARIDRFHALWLGYNTLPHAAALTGAMRSETRALIDKVVFDERRPWAELFTAGETYVDATLAALYGMTPPPAGTSEWRTYDPASGRAGILSHGSFLSVVGKFGDTSPTLRGKLIRERLMCQVILPPPPTVNVDNPPESPTSNCKYDRYAAHRADGSCASCHNQTDPVGFGLENFDQSGRWRDHDNGLPTCTIAGEGELFGVGDAGAVTFHGPGELGRVLVEHHIVQDCVVKQVYRFAMGKREDASDEPLLANLTDSFMSHGRFDQLVLDLVSNDAFGFRQEEAP